MVSSYILPQLRLESRLLPKTKGAGRPCLRLDRDDKRGHSSVGEKGAMPKASAKVLKPRSHGPTDRHGANAFAGGNV